MRFNSLDSLLYESIYSIKPMSGILDKVCEVTKYNKDGSEVIKVVKLSTFEMLDNTLFLCNKDIASM